MANIINVKSTVAQAEGFSVEVADTTLLASRYFPTTAGDEFAGKEVLFDFDSADLEKGAFITSGYKSGKTVSWIANSVIPPRVGSQDSIDPTDQDRVLFERLCRAQGADTNRAEAYQSLLNLKAARLAARTDRAKELLAALVLKEGKIDFDQDKDENGNETDRIVCKFYDPEKGANNHYAPAVAWGVEGSTPYDDICAMLVEGMKRGRRYSDLLLGANAWANLSNDAKFQKFAGTTIHSDGMMLDFGEVEGAQHVATAVFNGVQLHVIVYSGAYKNSDGKMVQYLDPDAAIIISEGIGRGLQGGCTLLNPDSIGYGIENSFIGLTGSHMQSIYKDFQNQKLYIREESRPLPAPVHSVNECDWIYCDTLLNNSSTSGELIYSVAAFGEIAHGVVIGDAVQDARIAIGGSEVAVSGATSVAVVRDGKEAEILTVTDGKIVCPIDADRDENDRIMLVKKA